MSDFAPPPPAPAPQPTDAPGFGPAAPGFGPADQGHAAPAPAAPAAPGFGAPAQGQPGQPAQPAQPQAWGAPAAPGAPGFAGFAGAYGVTKPVEERNRPGLAVAAAVGAMVASALVYAGVIDLTKHEIGYLALVVGLVIGLALGKIGGRHPALPVVGVVLALLGIFLGEVLGLAMLLHKDGISYGTIFAHLNVLFSAWKASLDAMSAFFFVIGGLEAFVFTRRFSGAQTPNRGRRR